MPHERLRPSFVFDEERLKQLQQIAPEAFADGNINWEVLKESLGERLEENRDVAALDRTRFSFVFNQKFGIQKLAQSTGQRARFENPQLCGGSLVLFGFERVQPFDAMLFL